MLVVALLECTELLYSDDLSMCVEEKMAGTYFAWKNINFVIIALSDR